MPNLSYLRPSLKQVTIGLLLLLAKNFTRAESAIDTIAPTTTNNDAQQPDLARCQYSLNASNALSTQSSLWGHTHFQNEMAIGNTVSFLNNHLKIQGACDQRGENYLFHLASHGSDDDFWVGLSIAEPMHMQIKNLAGESLMDILIKENNLNKINALVQRLPDIVFFKKAFDHMIHIMPGSQNQIQNPKGVYMAGFIVMDPIHPMNIAAKDHLIKLMRTPEFTQQLSTFTQFSYQSRKQNNTLYELLSYMGIALTLLLPLICCALRMENNNPGNNPNALFNQPNEAANRIITAETKPRLN